MQHSRHKTTLAPLRDEQLDKTGRNQVWRLNRLDATGQGEAVKNKTIETLTSTITAKPSEKE
jgi:hypothetical protein